MNVGDRVYIEGGYCGEVLRVEDGIVTVALDEGGEIVVAVGSAYRPAVRVVDRGYQTSHVGALFDDRGSVVQMLPRWHEIPDPVALAS